MPRKRRTPAEAKREILEAAEQILIEDGPTALRIARVAKQAGISHPSILHHFGSADGLLEALQQKIAREIREDLLRMLRDISSKEQRAERIDQALARISSPRYGPLLGWLVASGADPFPPVAEHGLHQVQKALAEQLPNSQQLGNVMLLALLAMYGESMLGEHVRKRLQMPHSEQQRVQFRRWLLQILATQTQI